MTVRSHARFPGASTDNNDCEAVCQRDKPRTILGGELIERGTRRVVHERLQHGWAEARVELASEHGGRDVEAGAHLALGEAVDKLRDVVRELP